MWHKIIFYFMQNTALAYLSYMANLNFTGSFIGNGNSSGDMQEYNTRADGKEVGA
jgi:hypothetical protein